MKRLRVAVIGAGHLGRIHARLLSTIAEVRLVGVVDPVASSRRQVAQEFNTADFPNHQPLLGQIDAAVVATPTLHHHSVGVELLRHGVHLLIEKPMARSVAECDELVAEARARGLVLQIGHVERFNPALAAAAPYVPKPKYIEFVRSSGYTLRSTDIGVVLDLMIHDIDVALSLVRSEVVDVEALGVAVFGRHEDLAHARLKFANGCVANLSASRVSYQAQRRMQVFAEGAYAAVDFASGEAKIVQPSEAILQRQLDVDELTCEERDQIKTRLFDELLQLKELTVEPRNAILEEQREFVAAVRSGGRVRVSGEEAREALAAAERILAKIADHRWTADDHGPAGPLAIPGPTLLRPPQWPASPAQDADRRRKAG